MMELVYNPTAGNGRSRKALARVLRELCDRGIAHHLSETQAQGHATQLTREAVARGVDGVAVLGGDGMLSEVCEALRGSDVTLFFVPCGTGNDFIRTLRLPKDPVKALRLQLDSPKRRIDCGTMNEFTFLNVAGAGFDIDVLRETERFKNKTAFHGMAPYLLGLLSGLKCFKPFEAEITLDGKPQRGFFTLISIANGQYIGGGMRAAPLADPADSLFEVVLVSALPKWRFYLYVPLFLPGLHIHLREVRRLQAKEVLVRSGSSFTVQLDGELKQVRQALFLCRGASLQIRCP